MATKTTKITQKKLIFFTKFSINASGQKKEQIRASLEFNKRVDTIFPADPLEKKPVNYFSKFSETIATAELPTWETPSLPTHKISKITRAVLLVLVLVLEFSNQGKNPLMDS